MWHNEAIGIPMPSEILMVNCWKSSFCQEGMAIYGTKLSRVCRFFVDNQFPHCYTSGGFQMLKMSGNNSVVECNLAKVEVAGSNPVSRSKQTIKTPVADKAAGVLCVHGLSRAKKVRNKSWSPVPEIERARNKTWPPVPGIYLDLALLVQIAVPNPFFLLVCYFWWSCSSGT